MDAYPSPGPVGGNATKLSGTCAEVDDVTPAGFVASGPVAVKVAVFLIGWSTGTVAGAVAVTL